MHVYKKMDNKKTSFLSTTRIRSMERGICPIAAVCTVVEI